MIFQLMTDIDASAEHVWQIVGNDFAHIADWSDTVDVSRPLSPEEVPTGMAAAPSAPVPGRHTETQFGSLREVLTRFDVNAMEFTYLAIDLPRILKDSRNTTTVTRIDDGRCRVEFTIVMKLRAPFGLFAPLLRKRMSTSGPGQVIRELKVTAEGS